MQISEDQKDEIFTHRCSPYISTVFSEEFDCFHVIAYADGELTKPLGIISKFTLSQAGMFVHEQKGKMVFTPDAEVKEYLPKAEVY